MTPWTPDGVESWGGRPIARTVGEACPRRRVVLAGTVTAVTVHRPLWAPSAPLPRHAAPAGAPNGSALDAEFSDGTGTIALRFTGRAAVPGVAPGAAMLVEGTVDRDGDRLVVRDPLYRFCGPK